MSDTQPLSNSKCLDLKICSWNVEGLAKYDGDCEFQSYFSNFHIIGLCETWAVKGDNFDNILPGYSSFDFCRDKKRKAPRGSGGVSVFVKQDLIRDGIVKRIFEHLSECVVMILDGHFFSSLNDIILVFTYISPENSPIYEYDNDNGIEILSMKLEQIITQYPEAHLFLTGDLNSRIKDFMDYVPGDDLNFIFGDNIAYPSDDFNMKRQTRDTQYNRFGLSLIELCCTYGIHVLNGRLFKDIEGNFTCTANNGTSIVDYMIASTQLFQHFTDFGIGELDQSDHFPLFCCIHLEFNMQDNNALCSQDGLETWAKFKWKPEFKMSYITKFRTSVTQFENNLNETQPEFLVSVLPNFIDIIKKSAVDMLCTSKTRVYSQPPWFDHNCRIAKRDKHRALRQYRLTNTRYHLNTYKNFRNKFKNICRNKKYVYSKYKRKTLMSSRNDPRKFWKILKEGN